MGNNQIPLWDCPPAVKSLEQYVYENGTASSVISLTHDTTAIEIGTGGTAAVMRWVTTSDTQASIIAIAGARNLRLLCFWSVVSQQFSGFSRGASA